MFKALLISSVFAVAGGAALALASDAPSTGGAPVASFGAPVFPAARGSASSADDVAPTGAQFRTRSGKSGVKFVACNGETRVFPGGAVELHCLSFSKTKGWGKSLRWYPKYQLFGLTGPMPVDPSVTASR